MRLNLLLLLFIFFSKFSFAEEKTVDPNLIHKNLRCLVCQGQSISDSNSDFAQTIKLVVKDLIDEGKTEDEIYEFMSDKYGDWIVFKPQFNTQNSLLWILPYIALIFGGFFIFSFFSNFRIVRISKMLVNIFSRAMYSLLFSRP